MGAVNGFDVALCSNTVKIVAMGPRLVGHPCARASLLVQLTFALMWVQRLQSFSAVLHLFFILDQNREEIKPSTFVD